MDPVSLTSKKSVNVAKLNFLQNAYQRQIINLILIATMRPSQYFLELDATCSHTSRGRRVGNYYFYMSLSISSL